MTVVQELKELGFDYESGQDEYITYKAHGSGQNDIVFVTVDVDSGSIEVVCEYAEEEKRALVVTFSEWNSAIVRLLEWWTL